MIVTVLTTGARPPYNDDGHGAAQDAPENDMTFRHPLRLLVNATKAALTTALFAGVLLAGEAALGRGATHGQIVSETSVTAHWNPEKRDFEYKLVPGGDTRLWGWRERGNAPYFEWRDRQNKHVLGLNGRCVKGLFPEIIDPYRLVEDDLFYAGHPVNLPDDIPPQFRPIVVRTRYGDEVVRLLNNEDCKN